MPPLCYKQGWGYGCRHSGGLGLPARPCGGGAILPRPRPLVLEATPSPTWPRPRSARGTPGAVVRAVPEPPPPPWAAPRRCCR